MSRPPASEPFRIDARPRAGGATVLAVAGEVDLVSAPELAAAIAAAGGGPVVVDLSEVVFMDSSGLNVILQATRSARAEGWSFAVAPQLSEPVARLFELTAMDGYLPFDGRA
ncbi:STAS domain-containing protein [Baekduia soli]|uniref:STAS domain-containing protein n=1 Tax=Baekduia soli TaxID=496014 RepID=UPI0016521B7E|nr:STAS domain-containing protein [Baekduia soli]